MKRLLVFVLVGLSACSGYTSALGFLARRAVMEDRIEDFDALMEEAAEAEPRGPLDNPKKTVLVHYLDFAGHPQFFERLQVWRDKGWVDPAMDCAIHRAHYQAVVQRDPAGAQRSADFAIQRAREAATQDGRGWEVEACLAEAPFLVDASTAAVDRMVIISPDTAEPLPFRAALLGGLTRIDLSGPPIRYGVDETPTPEARRAWAEARAVRWEGRLLWIIERALPLVENPLLARSTARGVLEVDALLQGVGRSLVGRYAGDSRSEAKDLAWSWIQSAKQTALVPELAGLGVWDRAREPAEISYWFICFGEPGPPQDTGLGPRRWANATTHRRSSPQAPHSCAEGDQKLGPYPLESVALVQARQALSTNDDIPLRIRLKRRDTGSSAPSTLPKI